MEFRRWLIFGNEIKFESSHGSHSVTAQEIVRCEFKNQMLASDIPIKAKPSQDLKEIEFEQPLWDIVLEIEIPEELPGEPKLTLVIEKFRERVELEEFPKVDHVVVNDRWFSFSLDGAHEIKELCLNVGISTLGPITLKQAFALKSKDSDLVRIINTSQSISPRVDDFQDDNGLDRLKSLGFKAELYPYQLDGFKWLREVASEELGCLLADQMGLGKTIQAIAVMTYFKDEWGQPSLIVCPNTLMENWRRELYKFSPELTTLVHSGSMRNPLPSNLNNYDVIITSYGTLDQDRYMLNDIEWGFVILDEAQYIKTPEANRSQAVKSMNRKCAIAITGTPVENRLLDLWSIMNFAYPDLLGSRNTFESLYDDDYYSAANLQSVAGPLVLRREVAEVRGDLPDLIIKNEVLSLTESEAKEYEDVRREVIEEYKNSPARGIVALTRLRQYCTHPRILETRFTGSERSMIASSKYQRFVEILDEIIATDQKALVFTEFTDMLALIRDDVLKSFRIPCSILDGSVEPALRQQLVDEFSNYQGSALLVCNPRVAGAGLNIQAANHVIHYGLQWNPATEEQATARAYRSGQKLPCTVHRLFYGNTVEEVMNERLERKKLLAETAVAPSESSDLERSDLMRALGITPLLGED